MITFIYYALNLYFYTEKCLCLHLFHNQVMVSRKTGATYTLDEFVVHLFRHTYCSTKRVSINV